jgi:uncharacterized protein
MVDAHGRFVWYELTTTDIEAAKAFYTKVLGWGAQDASMPGMAYTLFTVEGVSVAGLMGLPDSAKKIQAKPSWIGYVAVDDVRAAADRIERLGGAVHVPPQDIGDISRFSVFTDPQMAALALLQWLRPRREQPAKLSAPGRVGWHELLAADCAKALAFYCKLFDWQKADTDAAGADAYHAFSVGGETIGGMVTKPPAVEVPHWLFYFNVDDIDAVVKRVKSAGGQISEGPLEVPGGSWIARCTDPQGAAFALAGARRSRPLGYFEGAASRDPSDPRTRRWSW